MMRRSGVFVGIVLVALAALFGCTPKYPELIIEYISFEDLYRGDDFYRDDHLWDTVNLDTETVVEIAKLILFSDANPLGVRNIRAYVDSENNITAVSFSPRYIHIRGKGYVPSGPGSSIFIAINTRSGEVLKTWYD